jgi:hypothetical protein
LLVLMAVDFGRLFQATVTLNNAARIAANYASNHPYAWDAISSPTDAEQQNDYTNEIQREISGIGCTFGTQKGPEFPQNNLSLGSTAKVDLQCDFVPLTPLISLITGKPVTIGASAVFPIRTGVPGVNPPVPPCFNRTIVPNVVGLTHLQADAAIANANLVPIGVADSTLKGKPDDVKTQDPGYNACVDKLSPVNYVYKP